MTNGANNLDAIIAALPRCREAAESMREIMLAHITMIGEIPAPTFSEEKRVQMLADRFAELGLQSCSIDSKGSAAGILPGIDGHQNILVVANADTIVEDIQDQTIEFQTDRIIGPFVGDNCIGLAAMATLPILLEKLDLKFKSNIVFLAAARTQGRGNLEGVKFFLGNCGLAFTAGLCLESVQFGRLNYSCMGMMRGEITCRLPRNFDWGQFGAAGSIVTMSDIVNRISRIPLPARPFTRIVLGAIDGGISYGEVARETTLQFEVLSESGETIQQIQQQIEDITEDAGAQSGTSVTMNAFAHRMPGGLDISHPLVRQGRAILTALGCHPSLAPATSLQAALKDANIPALTLGLTSGERKHELDEIDESVGIAPLSSGLAQLVGVMQAIDGGFAS